MIPPNKYLTFSHNYIGQAKYNGTQNFKEIYRAFLKDPHNPINIKYLDFFNNRLSKIETNVINSAKICIIFVLEPREGIMYDSWKPQAINRDKILAYIKKSQKIDRKYLLSFIGDSAEINKDELISHINQADSNLIEALGRVLQASHQENN